MFLTWFLGGYAIGVTFWFARLARQNSKLKSERRELYGRLSEVYKKLGDSSVRNGDLEQGLRRLKLFYDSANACLPNGYPTGYDYSIVRSEYRICVFGKYKSYAGTDTTVCIKAIPIEDGDEEFAIREAEELIEIINKA